MAFPLRCRAPGRSALSRVILAVGCAAGCLAAAGCGPVATPPGGGPSSTGSPSTGLPSTGSPTGGPSSQPPVVAARQVFFDPQDLSTPDSRAVLTGPAQVSAYVRWLEGRPVPGRASRRLVDTLRQYRFDGSVLVVIARTVGCDSVGRVELVRTGAGLSLATFDVRHHPECLRANHLVAAFALPATAVPPGTTVDGSPPQTRWP